MPDGVPKRILLIQVRAPDDPMLEHERMCVRSRFGNRPVTLSHHNAVLEPAEAGWLAGVDGVVIGGSGDFSVHHPKSRSWVEPLQVLLDAALEMSMPGFAICFGHQLLGLHLGQAVITHPEYAELGTVSMDLTDAGRNSGLFEGMNSTMLVHSGHSDHVVGTPPGVDLLARNDATETQAFHVRGTQFYSVQFHPDMTGAEARYRYLAYRDGFAKRIDPDSHRQADKFQVGADVSTSLLGRFCDLIAAEKE